MRVIICENDAAMDSLLQAPAATAFDAVSALLSASVYLLVALAAIARAPRDARTRVFLAVAAASAAPYCLTALIWRDGGRAVWSRPVIVTVAASLMLGSLALLHFCQVFPWRRPWIRRRQRWLWSGYAAVGLLTVLGASLVPAIDASDGGLGAGAPGGGGLGAVSAPIDAVLALVMVGVLMPVLVVLGIVVPFAGLLSLYKSWATARARDLRAARISTWWMLVSQMGGGVLTILIIPLLRLVAPRGPWVTIAAALLFGFSLLMPLAFAAGVFALGVLDLDPEVLP
jgi:hypothetical protein